MVKERDSFLIIIILMFAISLIGLSILEALPFFFS